MKSCIPFCCLLLMGWTLVAQNSDWLPEGAVLYYAYDPPFSLDPVKIYQIEVSVALHTDSSEIRALNGGCQNCGGLETDSSFLERIERKVYYVTEPDSIRYLLYDFGAEIGDTVWHLGSIINGQPEYSYYVVSEIRGIPLFDTTIASRSVGLSWSDYQFACDIYDELGASAYLYPQYAPADPQIGPLVAYRDPTNGLHCFDTAFCGQILTNTDYCPFPNFDDRLYRDSRGNIYGVGIEEMTVQNSILTLTPNISVTDSMDSGCYSTTGGWMFQHVDIQPNGNTIFYTGNPDVQGIIDGGDTVHIKTQAQEGEEWIAMTTGHPSHPTIIHAIVDTVFEADVLGMLDTLKRIRFSSNENDAFDSLYIQVGKKSGLVHAVNFRQFDNPFPFYNLNAYDRPANLELVGKGLTGQGEHNLRWLQVWDFKVGDVFHIKQYDRSSPTIPDYREEKIGLEVLSKTYVADGVAYTYDRKILVEVYSETGLVRTFQNDTISREYVNDPFFNLLAGTYLGIHEENYEPYYTQWVFNDRESKCKSTEFLFEDFGFCLVPGFSEGCIRCPKYIKGLGGGYFSCSSAEGDYHSYLLEYYKKSDEEWGTPFDFTVSTQDIPVILEFKISPNPAGKFIHVYCIHEKRYTVTITDVHGRCLGRLKLEGRDSNIDVGYLSPGLYFVQFANDVASLGVQRLVIQR